MSVYNGNNSLESQEYESTKKYIIEKFNKFIMLHSFFQKFSYNPIFIHKYPEIESEDRSVFSIWFHDEYGNIIGFEKKYRPVTDTTYEDTLFTGTCFAISSIESERPITRLNGTIFNRISKFSIYASKHDLYMHPEYHLFEIFCENLINEFEEII